jgi:hypothetical protein
MSDYFVFKGVKYGIGTIVKVPFTRDLRWLPREEIMKEARFGGRGIFEFTNSRGCITLYEQHLSGKYEEYIEIISPVYYQEPEPSNPPNIFFRTGSGSWETHNEVCLGLVWYIVLMIGSCFLKERILAWAFTTIVFFLWKSKK